MKKILIGMLLVLCCVAFSAPVFAEIKVGGMVSTEFFYWNVSKERLINGGIPDNAPKNFANQSSYNSTEFGMGQSWNRLNVQYTSDDKKVGAFIEIRTGGQRGGGNSVTTIGANNGISGPNNQAGGANPTGEQNFDWELAYIDYHLTPDFYLRIGRQTQAFAIYAPEQQMGVNVGHNVLQGFGNIHGLPSREAIRGFYRFNDRFSVQLEVMNADSDGTSTPFSPGSLGELTGPRRAMNGTVNALPGLPASAPGGVADTVRESNKIPRIDVAFPIKFANLSVEPSFTWSRSQYRGVASGSDDRFDMWGASIGFRGGYGPFTLMGEYSYGKNLGVGTYVGVGNGQPITYARGNSVLISDTTSHSAWLQGTYDFGPFAAQFLWGIEKCKNDGDPSLAQAINAGYFDITRMAYGLQFPIPLAKNLKIVPQIWYYDYDGSAKVGGTAASPRLGNTDLGNEVLAGMFWTLSF